MRKDRWPQQCIESIKGEFRRPRKTECYHEQCNVNVDGGYWSWPNTFNNFYGISVLLQPSRLCSNITCFPHLFGDQEGSQTKNHIILTPDLRPTYAHRVFAQSKGMKETRVE